MTTNRAVTTRHQTAFTLRERRREQSPAFGFSGWRVALLTPDPRLAARLRLRTEAQHRLPHGGLRIQLLLFRA